MNQRLEDNLRAALKRQASEISAAPDTAERALAAGRRRLRRVRATGVVAAVLTVGAVVAGGSWSSSWLAQDRPPAVQRPTVPPSPSSPSPSPSPSASPTVKPPTRAEKVRQTERWLAGLPPASDTGLYSVHGRLHDAGTVVDLPHGDRDWVLGRVDGGWLVLAHSGGFTGAEDYEARYGILRRDGSFDPLVRGTPMGAGISTDGSQVAVAAATIEPQQQPSPVLRVVEATTGATLRSYRLPVASQVFGLVDGTVVYQRYLRGAHVWTLSPDGTRIQVLRGWLRDVAPATGLIAYERGRCTAVEPLSLEPTGSPVIAPEWQGCGPDSVNSFSPNGGLVLTFGSETDVEGGWPPEPEVLDLRTGERATFSFAGQGVPLAHGTAWAGDDAVLFDVGWPRRAGLISCEVVFGGEGDCRRVLPLTRLQFSDHLVLADSP